MAPRQQLVLALLGALVLAGTVAPSAASTTGSGKRVLALIGSEDLRTSHSKFFKGLTKAGLEVDIRSHKDSDLRLRTYDQWKYDHLVLFAPKATGFGGDISKSSIVDFVDSGGNVLIALSAAASDVTRSIAAECGVEADAKGTKVFDHFSRQAAGGATDSTLIVTSEWVDNAAILGTKPDAPVLFRGVAQSVPTSSELVTVALSGEPTTYSHDPKKATAEPPALPVGGTAALVSLVQARNNARIMVAGSLDMFGNELFDASVEVADNGKSYPKSGNRAFTVSTALWTFQQRGVLQVSAPRHRKVEPTPEDNPGLYRVNDVVEFEIDIHEVDGNGEKKPYSSDDVQLSFVMLDPHVRQPLVPDASGTFKLRFTVPDVYGVFKYSIDYARAGYSYVNLQQVVPVRPFRHDEYERFLLAAYPYYASALSTMVAFFALGFVYLYSGK